MTLAVLFPRLNLDIELEFLQDYLDDEKIELLSDFGDRILAIITPIMSIGSSDEIERLIPSVTVGLESLYEEYLGILQDALTSRGIGFAEFSREFNERLSNSIEEMLKEFEGLLNPVSYHRLVMAMDDKRRLDAWALEQLRIGEVNNIEQNRFIWAESDATTAHTVFLGIIAILAQRENSPSLI